MNALHCLCVIAAPALHPGTSVDAEDRKALEGSWVPVQAELAPFAGLSILPSPVRQPCETRATTTRRNSDGRTTMCTMTLVDGVLGFGANLAQEFPVPSTAPSRSEPRNSLADPASFCASVRHLALRAHWAAKRAHASRSAAEIRELQDWINTLEDQLQEWRASRADAFAELGGWIQSLRRWVSALAASSL
jgi:hypothetical protein